MSISGTRAFIAIESSNDMRNCNIYLQALALGGLSKFVCYLLPRLYKFTQNVIHLLINSCEIKPEEKDSDLKHFHTSL